MAVSVEDRGKCDFFTSTDFEDIICLFNGRETIVEEIANTLNPLVRSGKKLRLPAGNFGIMPNGQKEKELPLFGLSAGRGEREEVK